MDVKVAGQPEAAKLEKDNPVRFTGTLLAYDPDPSFMLHWDKAKVNAEDIPKEKERERRSGRRRRSLSKLVEFQNAKRASVMMRGAFRV